MSSLAAEEFKARGNQSYKAGDYTAAVLHYSKAIDADPSNAVYYNNRAAAYLELKRYAEAASDAERSAILAPSAKANARHGKALSLMGKHREAIVAYERALRHDGDNPEYKTALNQLKGLSATASVVHWCILTDAVLLVLAMLSAVLLLLSPHWAIRLWHLFLMAAIARQLIGIVARYGRDQVTALSFWKDYVVTSRRAFAEFEWLYLCLCVVFIVTSTPPQMLYLAALALYAAVDLAGHWTHVPPVVPPALMARATPHVDRVRLSKEPLLLNAAAFEALSILLGPFSGCSWISLIAIYYFVKQRYRTDSVYARRAWQGLHLQASSYAFSPRAPRIVGSVYNVLASLVHRAAQ